MSDDGLVKVEYTIDGEGKPDGTKWEATLLPTDWQELGWAELAEKIAAEHYEVYGPIGDPVSIAIYTESHWWATVQLAKVQTIITYQAIEVTDDDDEED